MTKTKAWPSSTTQTSPHGSKFFASNSAKRYTPASPSVPASNFSVSAARSTRREHDICTSTASIMSARSRILYLSDLPSSLPKPRTSNISIPKMHLGAEIRGKYDNVCTSTALTTPIQWCRYPSDFCRFRPTGIAHNGAHDERTGDVCGLWGHTDYSTVQYWQRWT